MSTRAQTVSHASAALSAEVEAALHLMSAPDAEFRARTVGRRTIVESGGSNRDRRCFAMLPNDRSPRTLIPMQPCSCTRRALQQIAVFASGARAAKFVLQVVAAVGALPRIARTLEVSRDSGVSLFDKVAQLTGWPDACFAVSFGTPSLYRKLTITVMRPDGVPLAFVKVPMTREAIARVEHEGEILNGLSQTALSTFVPSVLFRGNWNGQTALCSSAGPLDASPMQFGSMHRIFLERLWSIRSVARDGESLVSELAAQLGVTAIDLDAVSPSVVREAVDRARLTMKGVKISCGLSHGDFAPWNLRLAESGLFAFDWEAAEYDQPNLWDIAHFDTQLVTLLGRKSRYREITSGIPAAHELYVLYLLKSIANASRESGTASKQVNDRVRLLRSALAN